MNKKWPLHISILLLFLFSKGIQAQLINEFLVSKMDFQKQHVLWDGKKTMLMGYTRLFATPIDVPAPILTFREGDTVELKLRNMSQHASHTIHLHGLDVDQANDGVPQLSFEIGHDSTGSYFFKAPHPGTYIYHCHVVSPLHVQSGMYGLVIIEPADGSNTTWSGGYSFDTEQAWLLSEIDTIWHHDSIINKHHDPSVTRTRLPKYHPQYFLVNGRSEHQLHQTGIALNMGKNEVKYLRLAGIGNYGYKVYFPPQVNAKVISSDGRPLPTVIQSDSVELYPGERFGVLLEANADFIDSVRISYFNLNTQVVENEQFVPLVCSGYVSIDDFQDSDFQVFPNPATSYIEVDPNIVMGSSYSLDFIDSFGRVVLNKEGEWKGKLRLNVSDLSEGAYVLRLSSEGEQFLSKFLINGID